jgi:hypothetical protein
MSTSPGISPAHLVTFVSTGPNLKVVALLDNAVAQVIQGYGGWTEQDRARRRSLTYFTGPKPFKMDLPILFDGYSTDDSVEAAVKTIEQMATPAKYGSPPPTIKITGHVPHTDLTWVIDDVTWGDTMRKIGGTLVRQHLVIHLLQYVTADIAKVSATQKVQTKSKHKSKNTHEYVRTQYGYAVDPSTVSGYNTTYLTREGDSLTTIAAQQLGNYDYWHDIADLNGLRDPFYKYPGGFKMKIPVY